MAQSTADQADNGVKDFEDKRQYPRIVIDCPLTLLLAGAKVLKVQAYDISPGGIQICCDSDTVEQIYPSNDELNKNVESVFGLSIVLPLEGRQAKIIVQCRVAYSTKTEDGNFALGLCFTQLKGESRKILNRFIEVSLEPE